MYIDAEYWNGCGEEYLPCLLNADHIERARLCEDGTYEAVSVSGRAYRISKDSWEII